MKNVTDQMSNPFGMRPPCPCECAPETDRRAVFGYGDANADVHVIGDHSGIHGGGETGIPFTDSEAGGRVLDVLATVGLLADRDEPAPVPVNCFLSYLYLCCVPEGREPTLDAYAEFERFFDAELRAIVAHVLVPVGERATRYVLEEYTAQAERLEFVTMDELHATQIRGRGFIVLPLAEPADWIRDEFDRAVAAFTDLLDTDYHQMVDLGRFGPEGEPYFVR